MRCHRQSRTLCGPRSGASSADACCSAAPFGGGRSRLQTAPGPRLADRKSAASTPAPLPTSAADGAPTAGRGAPSVLGGQASNRPQPTPDDTAARRWPAETALTDTPRTRTTSPGSASPSAGRRRVPVADRGGIPTGRGRVVVARSADAVDGVGGRGAFAARLTTGGASAPPRRSRRRIPRPPRRYQGGTVLVWR